MSTLMKYIASCGLWACSTLVVAGNLIVNGDFTAGNSGFGSGYSFSAADDCMLPGVYDVVLQPADCHPYWAPFGDHSGDGQMMAINGADIANVEVWSETVSVVPETQYYFSTWIASSHPTSPAMLDFSINGTSIGTTWRSGGAAMRCRSRSSTSAPRSWRCRGESDDPPRPLTCPPAYLVPTFTRGVLPPIMRVQPPLRQISRCAWMASSWMNCSDDIPSALR